MAMVVGATDEVQGSTGDGETELGLLEADAPGVRMTVEALHVPGRRRSFSTSAARPRVA